MKYKILNPRLGTPGDEWVPTPGVNIDALVNGGFIVEIASPTTQQEPATVRKKKPKG